MYSWQSFSLILQAVFSFYWPFLLFAKALVWSSPISHFFLLMADLLEFYSGSCDICLPICSSALPSLSYSSFTVFGLTLKSLVHFELILVQGDRLKSSFQSSLGVYPIFSAPFVEEAVFSSTHFRFLCQKS
jgi:hypothetical protein